MPSESEKGDADLGAILLPKELAPGLEEKREQLAAEEHARRAAIKAGCAKRCAAIMKREQEQERQAAATKAEEVVVTGFGGSKRAGSRGRGLWARRHMRPRLDLTDGCHRLECTARCSSPELAADSGPPTSVASDPCTWQPRGRRRGPRLCCCSDRRAAMPNARRAAAFNFTIHAPDGTTRGRWRRRGPPWGSRGPPGWRTTRTRDLAKQRADLATAVGAHMGAVVHPSIAP